MKLLIQVYSFLLRKIIVFFQKHTKVNPTYLVFMSDPDFSDNSRAFSDYLVNHGYTNKYKIFWVVGDSRKYKNNFSDSNVRFLSNDMLGKFRNAYICSKAAYLFSTHHTPIPYPEQKKVGQTFVRLWHGCSYKDKDADLKKRERVKKSFDIALVAGPLFVKTKSYFWNCDENDILAKGYPRYDWLLSEDDKAKMYATELKGDADKLVIWMPTFRNHKGGCFKETQHLTQFPLMKNDEDWFELDRACREKGIKIIVKLHPKQKEYPICWDKFSNIKELSVSDMESKGTMLYPLLAVTDALISDYSSVAVDYMIVNKPIAYCLDDYALYKDARGFVVDDPREYMIGHHLYKLDDLLGFVCDIAENKDVYAQKRADIFDTLVYRSDCYCKELADYLQISK